MCIFYHNGHMEAFLFIVVLSETKEGETAMAENYREPEIIFEGWTAPEGTGIIVTGAASGIGAATAILAAQSGLKVAAWDMYAQGIAETIERAGEACEMSYGRAVHCPCKSSPALKGNWKWLYASAAAAAGQNGIGGF